MHLWHFPTRTNRVRTVPAEEDTQLPESSPSRSCLRQLAVPALRVLVAGAIFFRSYEWTYLVPTSAPRMVMGDWTTYIVAANYLRSTGWLTFPLGTLPDYVAPIGTSLGQTDALPVLLPLHRALNALYPGRPVQLLGMVMFVALVLTFLAVARFLDRVAASVPEPAREAAILALATMAVLAPFWNLQYVHVALMNQWIIIWAIAGAIARSPSAIGGRFQSQRSGRWTGLGPICAAAAVQPYLVPMVVPIALAPDLAQWKTGWRWILAKAGLASISVVAIARALGYIGAGGSLGADGFGGYAADLMSIIDPDQQSRILPDIRSTPGAVGGFGYPGLGVLIIIGAAAAVWIVQKVSKKQEGTAERAAVLPLRLTAAAVLATLVFAVAPNVRVSGRSVVDGTFLFAPFEFATSLFRVNGRFVWVALWFVILLAGGKLLAVRHWVWTVVLVMACLVVQLVDVKPFPAILRPEGSVEFDRAKAGLEREAIAGARAVELQPPNVIPGCPWKAPDPIGVIGDVLLASAVLQLPINSGYTARPRQEYLRINCADQSRAFRAGQLRPEVAYVVPSEQVRVRTLRCRELTSVLSVCRARE